jgi:hypothetical protein
MMATKGEPEKSEEPFNLPLSYLKLILDEQYETRKTLVFVCYAGFFYRPIFKYLLSPCFGKKSIFILQITSPRPFNDIT